MAVIRQSVEVQGVQPAARRTLHRPRASVGLSGRRNAPPRSQRRVHSWYPRLFLAVVGLLAVTTAVVVFVVSGPFGSDEWCDGHAARCGVGIHLIGTVAAGFFGYLFAYRVVTETRVALRFSRLRTRDPTQLMPWLSDGQAPRRIVGRQGFTREIRDELRSDSRPQVVVGGTGSGKTTLLIGLTRVLVGRGVVVVPLTLRDTLPTPHLSFSDLARERFLEYVDPVVSTRERAETVWRKLRSRNVVVVVADDLEKAHSAPSRGGAAPERLPPEEVTRALAAARREALPLVIASRPDGVPSSSDAVLVELEPVDEEEVLGELLPRAGPGKADADRLRRMVRLTGLTDNLFYLKVAVELAESRPLLGFEECPTESECRMELLEAYLEALVADRRDEAGLTPSQCETLLTVMEDVAYDSLVPGGTAVGSLDGGGLEPMLRGAERLGLLLRTRRDGNPRFAHATMQAYFAARRLVRVGAAESWRALLPSDRPLSPSVAMTLTLASAHGLDQAQAEAVCAALLGVPSRRSLLPVITAAKIAATRRLGGIEPALGDSAQAVPDATPVVKQNAIRAIASIRTEAAYAAVWPFAQDRHYAVRRTATDVLADGGARAFAGLKPVIFDRLEESERAARQGPLDDQAGPLVAVKAIAWLFPAVQSALKRDGDEEDVACAKDIWERLLALAGRNVTGQHGLRASIAQGLKLDALLDLRRHIVEPIPEGLYALLEETGFWYSRLLLGHAVALRCVALLEGQRPDSPAAQEGVRHLEDRLDREPHPLVRAACELSLRAVRDPDHWWRYIWDDEGEVTGRAPRHLDSQAAHVVGDIAVVLNLNEPRSPGARLRFGDTDALPTCLSHGPARTHILGADGRCPASCPFHDEPLCPERGAWTRELAAARHGAQPRPSEVLAHRTVSAAFCRHMVHTAKPPPWCARASEGDLRRFWREMLQHVTL